MRLRCYNRIMIDVTQDIHSLTTFKRNSSGLMKRMKKTGRPLVLTVNGKAEAVVLDAATYQEVASQLDAVASIRRGRQSAKSLARHPEGCPRAPESASFDEAIRELFFGSGNRGTYRFLFVVFDEEKSVYILHVRHGSMVPL